MEIAAHRLDQILIWFFEDQVVFLVGIVLHVVEFINVPNAVILNKLVLRSSQCESGRRVRKTEFPIVFV